MADYSKRTVRDEYVEFALPNPTNWGELGKALRAVHQELSGDDPVSQPDDVVTVHGTDDEIVLRLRAKREVNKQTVKVSWADEAVADALSRLEDFTSGSAAFRLSPNEQALHVAIDALRATVGS